MEEMTRWVKFLGQLVVRYGYRPQPKCEEDRDFTYRLWGLITLTVAVVLFFWFAATNPEALESFIEALEVPRDAPYSVPIAVLLGIISAFVAIVFIGLAVFLVAQVLSI